jgi:tRNA-dihydrouridine synthase B
MGYTAAADWSRATRVRAAVSIPIIINGDIRSATDARRALDETGCATVMIGRRAVEHPWIFRETRALLDHGITLPPPTRQERLDQYRRTLNANVALRGPRYGVEVTRRHLKGFLAPLPGGQALCQTLRTCTELDDCLRLLDDAA